MDNTWFRSPVLDGPPGSTQLMGEPSLLEVTDFSEEEGESDPSYTRSTKRMSKRASGSKIKQVETEWHQAYSKDHKDKKYSRKKRRSNALEGKKEDTRKFQKRDHERTEDGIQDMPTVDRLFSQAELISSQPNSTMDFVHFETPPILHDPQTGFQFSSESVNTSMYGYPVNLSMSPNMYQMAAPSTNSEMSVKMFGLAPPLQLSFVPLIPVPETTFTPASGSQSPPPSKQVWEGILKSTPTVTKTRAKWWWLLNAERNKIAFSNGSEQLAVDDTAYEDYEFSASPSILPTQSSSTVSASNKLPPRSKLKDLLHWVQNHNGSVNTLPKPPNLS